MNTNRQFSRIRTATLAVSALALMFSMSAFARLDGAIFTTTPLGDIVNENVRYQSKEEVFLDGGPGPQAPRTAAALPEGLYYFQVTDPSGKCLLSSTLESADTNGGTCYEDVKIKGKNAKNAEAFYAEPLSCRLFYFDGEDGVTFINDSYTMTQEVKVRGKMETQSTVVECRHQLGSEYLEIDPSAMPDGETIQLFPFANTPNSGGVYKAWVSTAESVEAACGNYINNELETGENCNGFFGFIPRNSKTDNFKALTAIPEPPNFDIALRSFHDKNLNCQYDPLIDEIIPNWEFGLRDLDEVMGGMRNTKLSNDSPDEPVRFSVMGVEDHPWSVDQFMWWAQSVGFAAMNTPFTHFTTFADLRDFAPTFMDGELKIGFANALACHDNITGNVRRSAGEDTDEASGEEESDTGFIPSAWAEPTYDDEPVLSIRFGSIGVARLEVCKSFDANGNGMHDEGESLIADWPVTLVIPDSVPVPKPFAPDGIIGNYEDDAFERLEKLLLDAGYLKAGQTLTAVEADGSVHKMTGSDGCVEFHVLVPNVRGEDPAPYSISEDVASLTPTWMNTSAYNITFDVESVLSEENGAPVLEGVVRNRSDGEEGNQVYFNNVCKITVDFDTKGYWHNKNGLAELTEADRDYVNGLDPYDSPTVYFGAGDEPFDGEYMDGTAVAAAFSDGSVIWGAGTWQSEVSHFLTDNNGNADLNEHKEQLAQQLLAFIFNTRHRPVDSGLTLATKLWFGGEWVSVEDIINSAIAAWKGSDIYTIDHIKTLLDGMNNNDAVEIPVSSPEECPAAYLPEES
ncbi:hypothetical protein [Vibrio sp. dhg]|uniref:hypothetical protein n=1 Tax=Vibrio sp. dhg TaxID=2163016 RepID=UPI000E4DC7D7|nr:hypothetical protein [Vibrio sp. dhg]AXT70514.1 hypothetical protein DBX26_05520 [Vibrio sp. dhg]